MHPLAKLDHRYLWHPFTQMRDWLKREPIVISEGRGAVLRDVHGREYLDANSSIWTNLHGHNHPRINAAIRRQLGKIAHSSALGFANEPASLLAAQRILGLRRLAVRDGRPARCQGLLLRRRLDRDGGRPQAGLRIRPPHGPQPPGRDSSRSQGAYHGDTVGAVPWATLTCSTRLTPACSSRPTRSWRPTAIAALSTAPSPSAPTPATIASATGNAWTGLERKFAAQKKRGNPYAAFVFEPLMQGAAGMIPQPAGWLRRAAEIARGHGALLIADEVMTGFGRTGPAAEPLSASPLRLPAGSVAARLPGAGQRPDRRLPADGRHPHHPAVFDAFLGEYDEFKTFFHGHSFTANQLGAAAALASLDILQTAASVRARRRLATDCTTNCRRSGAAPTSATSARSASSPASSWCATGARASRSTCASAPASASATPWPGAASSPAPSATSSS